MSQNKLKTTKEEIRRSLRDKAKMQLTFAVIQILGDGDLVILSALGIDGRQEILDIFIEQCKQLKKEMSDE